MSDPVPKRRKGPFWSIYKATYWTFSIGLGLSISISVTVRTCTAQDETIAAAGALPKLSVADCHAALKRSHIGLREAAQAAILKVDLHGQAWSSEWAADLTQLRTRCGIQDSADPSELKTLADDLDRIHLAWTTALTGYAEVGEVPAARLRAAFEAEATDKE